MGLPTSRDETIVNGAPVAPSLLNNLQDGVIGHERKVATVRAAIEAAAKLSESDDNALSTSHLFSFGGSAHPEVGVAGTTVGNHAGVIAQYVGTELLVKKLTTNELQTVHANGDATHPRWDLISIQLQAVDGAVTMTKTVTAGTPAASPVEPSTPANHVKWAAVRIPANQTAGSAALVPETDLRDYRVPVGFDSEIVLPDLAGAGPVLDTGQVHRFLPFPCGHHRNGRLLTVALLSKGLGTGTGIVELIRRDLSSEPNPSDTVLIDVQLGGAAFGWRSYSLASLAPIWLNGYPAGPNSSRRDTLLGLKVTADGDGKRIYAARFDIVGA